MQSSSALCCADSEMQRNKQHYHSTKNKTTNQNREPIWFVINWSLSKRLVTIKKVGISEWVLWISLPFCWMWYCIQTQPLKQIPLHIFIWWHSNSSLNAGDRAVSLGVTWGWHSCFQNYSPATSVLCLCPNVTSHSREVAKGRRHLSNRFPSSHPLFLQDLKRLLIVQRIPSLIFIPKVLEIT